MHLSETKLGIASCDIDPVDESEKSRTRKARHCFCMEPLIGCSSTAPAPEEHNILRGELHGNPLYSVQSVMEKNFPALHTIKAFIIDVAN
ncbi:hypothetical protein Cni_G17088 [Canna indica]|uniref:Uncharacterized protein n=1 Tax=Canna indica TaxID=4628 RepID=A0AAQ3KGB6_9LILI|nr:hypothetical protein Cni_G17088 [Canna indica]